MSIQFLCPQGHSLTAEDHQAGTEAKCPSCGVLMIIPEMPAVKEDSQSSQSPAPSTTEKFSFFCPQGHKLNGPVTLKGKPGKCPHCNTQFRIPADGDEEDTRTPPGATGGTGPESPKPSATADTRGDGPPTGQPNADASTSAPPPDPPLPSIGENLEDDDIPVGILVDDEDLPMDATVISSPTFPTAAGPGLPDTWSDRQILEWLWQHRTESAVVELLLAEGERLRPQQFAPHLSSDQFALFATVDGDRFSMRAIRWTDIKQVIIRDLQQLPDGFRT